MASKTPPPPAGKTPTPGAKKNGKKRPKRKRAGCGVFLFLLLVIGGGGFGYYVYDAGSVKAAWQPVQDFIDDYQAGREARRQRELDQERGYSTSTDNGPERVIEMEELDLRPLHQKDPRWKQALELGDAGVAQFDAAVKKHYDPKGEGDPFWFRSEQTSALEKIDQAVEILRDMREDLGDNETAANAIDRELRRYEKTLGSLGPKTHRR
jgi:hypothetical protein